MSMTNDLEPAIQFVIHERIGLLTFNRPDDLNTFRACDYRELDARIEEIPTSTVRALIITGRGRAFSAGQDLAEFDRQAMPTEEQQRDHLQYLQSITRKIVALRIPTIAAFNGFAVGFGLEIAIACDFRIATPASFFMFSEAKRGLFPTNGVLWLLPRLVGSARAKEMLLLADKFPADYALRHGLVSEVVPPEKLMDRATTLAKKLVANSGRTIEGINMLLAETYDMSLEQMLAAELEENVRVMRGPEFVEGITAFLQKRTPNFSDM